MKKIYKYIAIISTINISPIFASNDSDLLRNETSAKYSLQSLNFLKSKMELLDKGWQGSKTGSLIIKGSILHLNYNIRQKELEIESQEALRELRKIQYDLRESQRDSDLITTDLEKEIPHTKITEVFNNDVKTAGTVERFLEFIEYHKGEPFKKYDLVDTTSDRFLKENVQGYSEFLKKITDNSLHTSETRISEAIEEKRTEVEKYIVENIKNSKI